MKKIITEQEEFWIGSFGDKYADRNRREELLAGKLILFSNIITNTSNIRSIIEYGANIGVNLEALSQLLPQAKQYAIEINKSAAREITKWSKGKTKVFNQSIIDFNPPKKYDFVFIKGVLIHINPDKLQKVYASMYKASAKYIMICEYHNPTPVALEYRGHQNKLFKRDFCGEMMDKFPDLELIDYGFIYHRDKKLCDDDANWFLLKK